MISRTLKIYQEALESRIRHKNHEEKSYSCKKERWSRILTTNNTAHEYVAEFPKQKHWNRDNHVPSHLDALVRPSGAACMRKLDHIIGDPPIDYIRETRNDRHALRTEREEKRKEEEKRKGKKERNIERRSRRFISSPKGLDRFMNPIDRSAKKKGHKIFSRYARIGKEPVLHVQNVEIFFLELRL